MRSRTTVQLLALVVLYRPGQAMAATTYWLNQASGYSALPTCAEMPISAIVRGMVSGCGDNKSATSYSCFCTASSSDFQSIIATSVAEECGSSGAQVASATSVFHEYCLMGKNAANSTTTAKPMSSSTVIGSSTLATTIASSTTVSPGGAVNTPSSPIAPAAPDSNTDDGGMRVGTKIAIGVSVPVAAILAAGLTWFFFFRKPRPDTSTSGPDLPEMGVSDDWKGHPQENHHYTLGSGQVYPRHSDQELDAGIAAHELQGSGNRGLVELSSSPAAQYR